MSTAEEMTGLAFLRNMSEQHRGQIANIARTTEHPADTIVFGQSQRCPEIYIILSGDVGLYVEEPAGTSVEVSRLGPGELLGWSPVLGRQAMTVTARTLSRCRMAVLDVRSVLELCERDPRCGMEFFREVAVTVSERLWGARRSLGRALSHRPLGASPLEGSD